MKKFIGIFMIICLMATLCLVACNTHEHTFSESWEHDDTYHWHAATCEHTDEVSQKAKHIFVENTCKTCGYVRTQDEHKHTFSEEWEHDDTKHWHKATCGHSDLKSEEGGHTFVDGKCSVCGYERKEEDEHQHTFSDKWSYDETRHWHEAICAHKDVRSDESDHTFVDGKCSVCGYVKQEEEHKHTFSDKWEFDETKHWHEATCEHEGLRSEESEHVFENGKCIVCGYQHVHEFSEDWTTNLTYHWHASTCGHDVVEGMEAHNFEDGVCTVCNFEKPTEQHVHDENLTEVAGKEPTCTEKGLKAHLKCESCGTLFDKETKKEVEYNSLVIDAKGHKKPLIVHDEVKATCVKGGNSKYYECDVCKALFEDENAEILTDLTKVTTDVDPDNHSLKDVDAVKGDCSTHGTRAYRECEYCKTKFDEDGDVLTDDDLDLGYGEHGEIKYSAGLDPTCTTAGLNEYYYCEKCYKKFSDPKGRYEITQENYLQVPATGHSYVNQVPDSKGENGHTRICRDCGERETADGADVVIEHNYGENGGGKYCLECGYIKEGELPETGDIYLDGLIYEYDKETHNAKLTGTYKPESGYKDDYIIADKITFGGETYTVTEIGENVFAGGGYLPHEVLSVVVPDTVTTIKANAFGKQAKLGKVVLYNTITSLDSSAFNNCGWLIIYFKGDKTELESNEALKSISDKARYYAETKPETDISNYWHFTDKHHEQAELYQDTFEWFDCSNGIVYKIDETSKTATAARVELKTQNVSIPKEIYVKEDTYTVTTIAERLFYQNNDLKSVDIGDGVETIMKEAFYECASLQSVTFGKELTTIGEYAFYHCENLQSIVIPKKVTRIGTCAFNGCVLFESLEIPDSVTQIGDRAFSLCSGVKTIKIGKGLTSFEYMTFYNMPQLESIEVAAENTHYFSQGNCIVERSTKTLVLGCKTSVIPENVTTIGNGAFDSCTALTRIVIPSSVTTITRTAFMNCSGLVEVIIKGENLKYIRDNAFNGCSSLESIVIPKSLQVIGMSAFTKLETKVYYTGTKTQWESLQKSGDVKDKTLFSAPVYFYSATEPSESESYDSTLNYWHYDANDDEKIIVWDKKS